MSIASQWLPIDVMNAGEHGIVAEVDGQSGFVARLQEMGLNRGAHVRMIKPGSPCILEVNHHRLSIRFDDSATVLVDVHT